MLTTRSLLMTSAGLLTGFVAAAQSTPAAGLQPTDILSWVTWFAAGVVLLMAIISGASATSAAQRRYQEAAAEPAAAPVTPAAAPVVRAQPAPALQATFQPATTPARTVAATQEAIAA
ncbi:MAG: hypothetical protein JWR44_3460 [Hymenobacter sp.]|jgi:hypothetical protein|nr:hypothetical protein [Hymenobacter sp.]